MPNLVCTGPTNPAPVPSFRSIAQVNPSIPGGASGGVASARLRGGMNRAQVKFPMGWVFPTMFLTVMRHITPNDLHSVLTIIRTMRASTSTPPGRAGYTIWPI